LNAPSDARVVSRRILTIPRLTAVAAAGLLVSATISLAADKPAAVKKTTADTAKQQQVMVVPEVTHQLFVFASGTLEDNGFGWKVRGSVGGYPSNLVVAQSPKAGTHVVNTGEPTITLHLQRKGPQTGEPQNRSPYGASMIRRPAKHTPSQ
jgi:hypothetical protein